jgi:hypothetical protein
MHDYFDTMEDCVQVLAYTVVQTQNNDSNKPVTWIYILMIHRITKNEKQYIQ